MSAATNVHGLRLCCECSKEICDKYYLQIGERAWHEECLKCNSCQVALVSEETCFIKKNKIFCKVDYYKCLLLLFVVVIL